MTESTSPINIFEPRLVRAHRTRAATRLDEHDFLFREVAERLADRLSDTTRAFPLALDLGCHGGEFGEIVGARGAIETLIQCDPAAAMARRAGGMALAAEADALPFGVGKFDLIVSNMSLHWVNDLPGALIQIRQALKPDGMFIATLAGGGTLGELRGALLEAETELAGGASPRVSPFVELRDAGALLQRAGFALPVADGDLIPVRYENALRLMADLRGMGEANALAAMARHFTRRDIVMRAAEIYRERHEGPDGRIPASFQIVYLTGWAPDPSQQKPAAPGSATTRLADALGTTEKSTGDKAKPLSATSGFDGVRGMQKKGKTEPTAMLPVVATAQASYRFVIDHPREVVRVGWLPLLVLYGLNLVFGTFEPMPDFSDPQAAMSRIAPLLGNTIVNVLIQSAVAAMTLVVWHRLVMQDHDVGGQRVPMRVTVSEIKYLGRWLLIGLLFIAILFAADIAIVMAALVVMLTVQLVSILVMGGAGLALDGQAEQLTVIGQIGMAPAAIAAIYLTTRLALVLPATATGKEARFERAWYMSRGNGGRMVLASLIVMAPLQIIIWGLMKVTGYMADTMYYYPLALVASAAFLLFILITGTVLSLFSLGLDREPAAEEAI